MYETKIFPLNEMFIRANIDVGKQVDLQFRISSVGDL